MYENLNSFSPESYSVPVPGGAMVQAEVLSLDDDLYHNGPRAAGVYEVRNALVDKDNRIGAWSAPFLLNVNQGWSIFGGAWNQPVSYEAIGVAWKLSCIFVDDPRSNLMLLPGQDRMFAVSKNGTGPASIQAKYPWGRLSPRSELLMFGEGFYPLSSIRGNGIHETIAPPPPIVHSSLSGGQAKFARCFVTATGETSLSVFTEVPATAFAVAARQFLITGCHIPPGAIGYRIYVQFEGETEWKRCACGGVDVYQLDNCMPWVTETVEAWHALVAPVPTTIDPINSALLHTNGDIHIGDGFDVQITQPIIDMYAQSKWGRTIGQADKGRWNISVVSGGNFPALLVQNHKSRWNGFVIQAESSTLSAGIAFSDPVGDGCMGNRFDWCAINLNQTGSGGRNTGIRILNECRGNNTGHSASEIIFSGLSIGATNPIWLENNQTANIMFRDTGASAFLAGGYFDIRDSVVYAATPNLIRFDGMFYCDCPTGTIFRAEQARIVVDQLFVDKGCVSLIDFPDYISGFVKITEGAVNFFRYPSIQHSDGVQQMVRAPSTLSCHVDLGRVKFGDDKLSVVVNGDFGFKHERYAESNVRKDLRLLT